MGLLQSQVGGKHQNHALDGATGRTNTFEHQAGRLAGIQPMSSDRPGFWLAQVRQEVGTGQIGKRAAQGLTGPADFWGTPSQGHGQGQVRLFALQGQRVESLTGPGTDGPGARGIEVQTEQGVSCARQHHEFSPLRERGPAALIATARGPVPGRRDG